MASLFGLLNLAREGLTAQSAAVRATADNITNASVQGYVRRDVNLETRNVPGGGVIASDPQRQFDRYAFARVVGETAEKGRASARNTALDTLQQVVAPTSGDIASTVTALFQSFSDLSTSPGDTTTRSNVLTRASDVAAKVSQTSQGLSDLSAQLLSQSKLTADEVNDRLASIAKLNDQIKGARASGSPDPTLEDRRDALVRDVAQRIGAKTVEANDGTFTLLSSGVALVSGNTASKISVDLDPNGATRVQVVRPSGATSDITSNVTDGSLGAMRQVRDTDIVQQQATLDQFAYDFAKQVNASHRAGFGSDGVNGRNLFVEPTQVSGAAFAMALDPAVAGQPGRVGAAGAPNAPGDGTNALVLAQLSTAPMGVGTGSASDRLAAWLGGVGVTKASAANDEDVRVSSLAQAETAFQSSSGVSLDEEMIKLTQYQRAFEASSKVLAVADQLLQELIQKVGG